MAAPVHDSLGDPNGSVDDYSLVKKRTNVLLLGDHIGDLGMSDGLNYENRIAAGFLFNFENVRSTLADAEID
ncbi:unnamed protein product [Triticum turgidum subsp. durum]|uniref:5'-nucleotidase n=1 Tax=Triticum turgidum subsp. durum TaxID=4567 RepID=A0A9R1AQ83_TRITD|nr:unnamed protein product [Triticum turgidum subsp. durum]